MKRENNGGTCTVNSKILSVFAAEFLGGHGDSSDLALKKSGTERTRQHDLFKSIGESIASTRIWKKHCLLLRKRNTATRTEITTKHDQLWSIGKPIAETKIGK